MSDIKGWTNKELTEKLREERGRYQKMKFQNTVSQIEQPHKIKETRKNIARLLTEINDRRIDAEFNAMEKKLGGEN